MFPHVVDEIAVVVDEIAVVVEVCRSLGVPLIARGAGASLAGNAVGSGVVLDFSRHLNRVHDVDPASATAVVDPGVVLDDLQLMAAPTRAALRPGPVHPQPLHDRRQQREVGPEVFSRRDPGGGVSPAPLQHLQEVVHDLAGGRDRGQVRYPGPDRRAHLDPHAFELAQ
ncbi:FAD-binding protein [Nonomuraea sp. NPDC026600]|uniref:FAD-binding oxidoreductase n=1 Tax=Nonomuraea sp. NPDC026600 TaxID=3155363 RepID=UPI0033D10847